MNQPTNHAFEPKTSKPSVERPICSQQRLAMMMRAINYFIIFVNIFFFFSCHLLIVCFIITFLPAVGLCSPTAVWVALLVIVSQKNEISETSSAIASSEMDDSIDSIHKNGLVMKVSTELL